MDFTIKRLAGAVLLGACLTLPSTASGAQVVDDYPANQVSRDFGSPVHGWAEDEEYGGLACVVALTCPSVDNLYQPADGSGGPTDGFIQTRLNGLAATLLGDSSGIWTSPNFVYDGAGGARPDKLRFSHAGRADVDALLAIPGNTVDYSVRLVNVSSPPASLTLVDEAPVTDRPAWTARAPLAIDPADLVLGHTYRIEITTDYDTVVAVIPDANADYDDVALTATRKVSGGGAVAVAVAAAAPQPAAGSSVTPLCSRASGSTSRFAARAR